MSDEDDIIDVEVENLPVVVEDKASNCEAMELPNRQDTLLSDNPERRCVATNSRGQRCRKFAIMGATVCRTHGGATQHVRNKARIRVENASNRLMGKLIDFAFDDTKPPDIQLRAIQNALDRAGLKPPAEVVLSPAEPKPYENVFDSIATGTRDQSRAARGYRADPGIGNSRGESLPSAATDDTSPPATAYTNEAQSPETGFADETQMPPPPSTPHQSRRDMQPQPPARHITGEAAMHLANEANRQIGALPPMRALEGPNRR